MTADSPGAGLSGFDVELAIYDLLGRKVRTLVGARLGSGNWRVLWNGKDDSGQDVSSGIYFYCLKTGEKTIRGRKMLLLK
jgi:flagellar hook assembly protein FlgD